MQCIVSTVHDKLCHVGIAVSYKEYRVMTVSKQSRHCLLPKYNSVTGHCL